jgi:hypothetical protein
MKVDGLKSVDGHLWMDIRGQKSIDGSPWTDVNNGDTTDGTTDVTLQIARELCNVGGQECDIANRQKLYSDGGW